MCSLSLLSFFFFFNDPATTEIYTLSLHDALPISPRHADRAARPRRLLEAGRRRADLRVRPADVHHRGRDPSHHPADGDHAPVRLLRGLERRRELPALSRAPARLEPRE